MVSAATPKGRVGLDSILEVQCVSCEFWKGKFIRVSPCVYVRGFLDGNISAEEQREG